MTRRWDTVGMSMRDRGFYFFLKRREFPWGVIESPLLVQPLYHTTTSDDPYVESLSVATTESESDPCGVSSLYLTPEFPVQIRLFFFP